MGCLSERLALLQLKVVTFNFRIFLSNSVTYVIQEVRLLDHKGLLWSFFEKTRVSATILLRIDGDGIQSKTEGEIVPWYFKS